MNAGSQDLILVNFDQIKAEGRVPMPQDCRVPDCYTCKRRNCLWEDSEFVNSTVSLTVTQTKLVAIKKGTHRTEWRWKEHLVANDLFKPLFTHTLCVAEFVCAPKDDPLVCEVRLGAPTVLNDPRIPASEREALQQSKSGHGKVYPIKIVKVH